MFQVLVKTTPVMLGSYSYDLVSREAAEVFVKRSDVWWWCFPVDEDTLTGNSWRKGGAWEPDDARDQEIAMAIPLDAYGVTERRRVPPEDGDDDDRW